MGHGREGPLLSPARAKICPYFLLNIRGSSVGRVKVEGFFFCPLTSLPGISLSPPVFFYLSLSGVRLSCSGSMAESLRRPPASIPEYPVVNCAGLDLSFPSPADYRLRGSNFIA